MRDIIDAKTQLCGLIGNPVGHSISPFIHNNLSEKLGINLAYSAFKVEEDDLDTAVRGAFALGIKGMNVTVPHKCNVIKSLVGVDELAGAIGAVNTLVRNENGYIGYNTDYIGLWREMEREGIIIKGREFIILGAGGASRAATFMCAAKGASKIYLLNRTLKNAESLAKDVNEYIGNQVVIPMSIDAYDSIPMSKYTVIQTTSKGLFPDVEGSPIEEGNFYDRIENAVDIIFNPAETKFMRLAKQHGAKAYNGLLMLLYQAVAAYELWNDIVIPEAVVDDVYELMKKKMAGQL